MLPKNWIKLFISGVVIPAEMMLCSECNGNKLSDMCNNEVNEDKDFEANISLLRRMAPNQIGHRLPYYRY